MCVTVHSMPRQHTSLCRMQCTEIHVDDLRVSELRLSEKKKHTWIWRGGGRPTKREQVYVEVRHGATESGRLVVRLGNVRTVNGVQITTRYRSGFMSIDLCASLSRQVHEILDDPLFQLCFERRAELARHGKKMATASEMTFLFSGLVTDGGERPGGLGCYADQITCTVPTTVRGTRVVVDPRHCTIVDLDGTPYSADALRGKDLKEVAIELERIVFDKTISVRARYRRIVVDARAATVVTTKRKRAMISSHQLSMEHVEVHCPSVGVIPV